MTQELEKSTVQATMSRLERKLVIPPQSADFVAAWLRHTCMADPTYPLSRITSLYLDTPELDAYYECLNGDIYKNKVRIRWYDQPTTDQVPVYVELKSKRGFNTVKQRHQVQVPNRTLNTGKAADIVGRLELQRILFELGYMPQKQLCPVITISYRRYRFREPISGISVTFDLNIASWMAEQSIAVWAPHLELQTTVLELKGGDMAVPSTLQGLRRVFPRWSAFSKYAKCLESHLMRPNSIDWLKP